MRWLFLSLILCGCASAYSQVQKIDSLRASLPSNDTSLINRYLQISELYRRINLDSMYVFGKRAHTLSVKKNYKKGEARANLFMSISEWKRGNLPAGLELSQKALDLSIECNSKETQAETLSNIGLIYNYQGDYPLALNYYQKGLTIAEPLNNKSIIAGLLINIGGLHYNLKEYNLALDYWKRTLVLREQIGDKPAAAMCMNNIGMAYADKGEYKMSLTYYFRSLNTQDPKAACAKVYPLENIGNIYLKIGKLDSAEFFLNEALAKITSCNDPLEEMSVLTSLANTYTTLNQLSKALPHLEKAMTIGLKSGFSRETSVAARSLSEVYEKLGRTKEAFATFKTYHAIQDSIYNNDNAKAIGKLEAQYEYESAKKEQKVVQRIADLEKEKILAKEKWLRNSFIAGFVAMIIVAAMVYRNFRRKQISNHRLRLLNKEIKKQQKKLISQSKQLKKLNKSLNELNDDLELKIGERTQELNNKNLELENKNLKLANYAFLNAHKLRAPVATLLGLVMLFDNKKVDNSERDEIVNKIKDCAADLNDIVREIRNTLEMEKSQSQS